MGSIIYSSQNVNVRANVSCISYSRYENDVPYSLFSDNSGDYNGQIVPAGNYILSATHYTDFNGGGSSGTARVVSFTR